jgi:hypothetical protein
MQLCDQWVGGALDFSTLNAIEALAEFRDYSSAASRAGSGLRADLQVF